jgi:hypothetical protein
VPDEESAEIREVAAMAQAPGLSAGDDVTVKMIVRLQH